MQRRQLLQAAVGAATIGLLRGAWAADPKVPVFALEDQWERKHDQAVVFRGGNVVMIGGDQRATGDRIGEWAKALDGAGAVVWAIADLDGVPFFVPHGSIRSSLRASCPKTPVLLDWKGKVYAPLLGFPAKKEIVVQVHGPQAQLLARVEGPPTPERIASVKKAAGV